MGTCTCNSSSTTCTTSTSTCSKCGRYQISWNDVRFKPNWVSAYNVPQTIKVSLTSVEALALFTTAKALMSSPGPGNLIDVISVKIFRDAGTTPYTSANPFQVRYIGATNPLLETDQAFVEGAADGFVQMGAGSLTLDDNVLSGVGLELFVPSANPTLGDGTFDVYITYRIITL